MFRSSLGGSRPRALRQHRALARKLAGVLMITAVASFALVPSAAAQSVTGELEDLTPCPPDNNNLYCTGYAAGYCAFNSVYCAGYAVGSAAGSSLDIALDEFNHAIAVTVHGIRRGFATDANDLLDAIVGETFAQVERLTGLKAWVEYGTNGASVFVGAGARYGSTSVYERVSTPKAGCVPPLCWPVFAAGQTSDTSGDSVSNLVWNNSAIRVWNPNDETPYADGRAVWSLYTTSSKPRLDYDFWATSQKASVAPANGKQLEGVIQAIASADDYNPELIDWDPISVNSYGSAGTASLGASLGAERFGASASFSIGRTWNFSEGSVGGSATHDGIHWATWWKGGGGSTYSARGVNAVETWKTPTDTKAKWYIHAEAHLD